MADLSACVEEVYEELVEKVAQFRAKDLKDLLRYVGQPLSGNKSELCERFLKQARIKRGSLDLSRLKQYLHYADIIVATNNVPVLGRRKPATAKKAGLPPQPSNSYTNGNLERGAAWAPRTEPPVTPTSHHGVTFRPTPFHETVATLLPPVTVDKVDTGTREHTFSVPAAYMEQVKEAAAVGHGRQASLRVLLRVCPYVALQTDDCPDQFPDTLMVRINGHRETYAVPPTAANQKLAYRKVVDMPKDLTVWCAANMQRATITMATPAKLPYVGGVYLARHKPPELLADELAASVLVPEEKAWEKWLQIMHPEGADSDVAAMASKLSLLCPISKMRITRPARGSGCHHVQCFDLLSYLSINERRPAWMCPVCNRSVPFAELQLDGYFKHVLESSGDVSEVLLDPATNRWSVPSAPSQPASPKRQHSALALSSDDDQASTPQPGSKRSKPDKTVIDLTLDSDDDGPALSPAQPQVKGEALLPPLEAGSRPTSPGPALPSGLPTDAPAQPPDLLPWPSAPAPATAPQADSSSRLPLDGFAWPPGMDMLRLLGLSPEPPPVAGQGTTTDPICLDD